VHYSDVLEARKNTEQIFQQKSRLAKNETYEDEEI